VQFTPVDVLSMKTLAWCKGA